jgi:RNA polymerase sigma factor (sigma-70 family)
LTGRPGPESDDLVQEALFRALRKSHQYRERAGSDLCSWTSRILKHTFVDGCRKQRNEVLVPDFSTTKWEHPGVDVAAWRYVEDADLDEAVAALPSSLRETYRLFAAGHGYAAIGSHLAIPVRTVGVRIYRARARLRAALRTKVDGIRAAG